MLVKVKTGLFWMLRRMPAFKGKGRLTRFIFSSFLKSQKDIIVNGKHRILYKLPNLIENIGFEIMLNGNYEHDTIDFIVKRLPYGAVFIDIGANIGAISIPVCKRREDIRTYCVEASRRVFEYLETNIKLNGINNASLINKPVTDKTGEMLNFYSPEELFGKGSRSPVYTQSPELMETISLSTLCENMHIEKVDFVKVDVEGYEYDVFKGGKGIFEKDDAPDIIFEFLKWAEEEAFSEQLIAQELLKEYGYTLFEFGPHSRLTPIDGITKNNYAMIFATKKHEFPIQR